MAPAVVPDGTAASPAATSATSSPTAAPASPTAAPASAAPAASSATPVAPHLRLEGIPGPQLEGILPQARVSLPPLDRAAIRSSLDTIEAALERENAFQELQQTYSDLLQAHVSLRHRVADLEHELAAFSRSAAPFVTFVQERYDRLRGRLNESERVAAERLWALEETEHDRIEIRNLRDRLRHERGVHDDAVADFQAQIAALERELQAARDRVVPASNSTPDDSRLQTRLNEAVAARLLAEVELTQVQDQVRALETSQHALEASSSILRQQVATLERRIVEARQRLVQEQTRSERTLDRSVQERNRLQGLLDQSDLDLQARMAEIQRLRQERDRAQRDSARTRDQVAAARAAIARLEQRASDLQQSVADSQRLRDENGQLQTALQSIRDDHQQALVDHDRVVAERDDARSRLANIMSVIQSGASTGSFLPTPSSLHKRHQSTSPSRSSSGSPSLTKSTRSHKRRSRRRRTSASNASHDQDEALLAVLARSRSEGRRSRSSSSRQAGSGTPHRPIHVDPSSSGSSSPDTSSASSSHSSGSRRGGGDSPDHGSPDGSSSSDQDSDESANSILSDHALDQLDPTVVHRDQWIPGYRRATAFAPASVDPWSARALRTLSIRRLTVELLFHHWCCPEFWLFPQRRPAPHPSLWDPSLITSAHIRALYRVQPWNTLNQDVVPRSFNLSGWHEQFARMYLAFEEEFRQVYWEATHKLPITKAMKDADSALALFWVGRKQRRSRAGPRWKTLLKFLLAGMIAGHCDLDLLLDPFFLHLPRITEHSFWYPGLGMTRPPADLAAALTGVDVADPWRNQFRTRLADHPGNHIARLDGKFRPAVDES